MAKKTIKEKIGEFFNGEKKEQPSVVEPIVLLEEEVLSEEAMAPLVVTPEPVAEKPYISAAERRHLSRPKHLL